MSNTYTGILFYLFHIINAWGFPGGASGKEHTASAEDVRDEHSIPGSGRFSRGRHSNPLQYSCLESPMDRGAWWATVHRFTKSQT